MIHKISIENFSSIAGRQELSFEVPGNAPALPCFREPLKGRNDRLPTVIGFFGANASGKSTVLHAVYCALKFACLSFEFVEAGIFFQVYRQHAWKDKPTKIAIDFDCKLSDSANTALFRYELHIGHANDYTTKKVVYESLSYAPHGKMTLLFERKENQFHFGKDFGISNKDDPRKDSIRPNASVISTFEKFNHPQSTYIAQQLRNLQMHGFDRVRADDRGQLLQFYFKDKNGLNRLNNEIRRFDIGLESMIISSEGGLLHAKFQHSGLDGFIHFDEESAGTRRFIEIFPKLYYILETGGVAIIDEIDSDLHPLLLPELLRWFSSKERNPHNAQLLFTAHSPSLLDELEKEQVFFTEKQLGKATTVYGARDIKGLRREPSLMRKYLSGELGAIPRIG